jgi:hypothetical protein
MVGAQAAVLAGETNNYREFINNALIENVGTTNWQDLGSITAVALLLPDSLPDLDPIFTMADALPPPGPELLNDIKIEKGMAAYRRGRLTETLRWFKDWQRCDPSRPEVVQAACFCAMVHFQQGNLDLALAEMDAAATGLAKYLHSGHLGPDWQTYAQAAAAYAEAERLISGREAATAVDSAQLETARKRWAPISSHLNHGDALASQRKWSAAREEYLAALHDPVFDWGSAERAHNQGGALLLNRIASVFLCANDATSHEKACEECFARWEQHPDPLEGWHLICACLSADLSCTNALTQKADEWANAIEREPHGVSPNCVALIRTMTAYRSGRYEEAVEQSRGADGGRLTVRNAAAIFRAMALGKLGRWEQGRKELANADQALNRPLLNLTGDMWWDLTMCQVVLDEAYRLFRQHTGN